MERKVFVSVKFNPDHSRTYTYTYDGETPLVAGDLVLVETNDGTKTVHVDAVDIDAPPFACKPIKGIAWEDAGPDAGDGHEGDGAP